MINLLINLLVALLIIGVVFWICKLAVEWLGGPEVITRVVGLILLLVFLLHALKLFGIWAP